jgi:hypothetical protein
MVRALVIWAILTGSAIGLLSHMISVGEKKNLAECERVALEINTAAWVLGAFGSCHLILRDGSNIRIML